MGSPWGFAGTVGALFHVKRPDTICPVPGARCPVPGARCPVPGARCPVPGARCPVPGARCPVPGARCPVPGARCPVPGARCPVPGARCPVPGARCPVPGARCPVPGARFHVKQNARRWPSWRGRGSASSPTEGAAEISLPGSSVGASRAGDEVHASRVRSTISDRPTSESGVHSTFRL
ncbi:hypothetical protein [Krasilnikovia sp. M28-CT-15]|uniref:hypothetical protein n=1 Tax=Krasilnikovia sp. M28-CT-15 TaxID=3373540 RepID=UPI00399D2728